ncbi:MAG: TolC family protein [Bacteroidota bacterium]
MKLKIYTLLSLAFLMTLSLHAQEKWSLERCILYAQENSLEIKQAKVNAQSAELDLKLNRSAGLPSINANVNGGMQFGRTIDPTTNQFRSEATFFNSYGVTAQMTVYQGGRIRMGIKQSELDVQAALLDVESSSYNLSIDVATAYLNILLSEEQLVLSRTQLELTNQQLEQTDKLIAAGSLPEVDRYDIVTQIAQRENDIITAQNSLDNAYLAMRQLLLIDPSEPFDIEKPTIEIPENENADLYTVQSVYSAALNTIPSIRAAELRKQSAVYTVDIAKTQLLPAFFVSGGLNTSYSDRGRQIGGTSLETTTIPFVVSGVQAPFEALNGTPLNLNTSNEVPFFIDYPYFDQLSDNFGQSLSAGIQIPIFNRNSNVIAIQRAKLGVINADLNDLQVKQGIQTAVLQAVTNAKASQRSLAAFDRTYEASQIAFENAQKRFELGAINTIELVQARNTRDQSEINQLRGKYQHFFNLKVVDFYLGKPLKIN